MPRGAFIFLPLLVLVRASVSGHAIRRADPPPPVTAVDMMNVRAPEEIAMPPEESVPDRRDCELSGGYFCVWSCSET